MKEFIKSSIDQTPIEDNVFKIVSLANEDIAKIGKENVINGTIGALYDEQGQLVALDSVFDTYNHIENNQKAKYAASFRGNDNFRQQVLKWISQGSELNLASSVIATPGGSGAVSSTIINTLDAHETLILPSIAWGSYKLMAGIENINVTTYEMFDGDHFNLNNFKEVCQKVMDQQGKVVVVINDPCHNPTGYSMSHDEWQEVIAIANELSSKGPFVILNDIAYIDYSYQLEKSRTYMNYFNDISDNVMVVVAFSCSKTLTSYGLRCGAAVVLAKQKESVRQMEIVLEKHARANWSNIPNAAMENFVRVTTQHLDSFLEEKNKYVQLLKERSTIFTQEAEACGLQYYPYKEGFFVTLKIEDNQLLTQFHEALMNHHIYTVKVNKGIRVGICSLSVANCKGLAKKMKDILDQCQD